MEGAKAVVEEMKFEMKLVFHPKFCIRSCYLDYQ